MMRLMVVNIAIAVNFGLCGVAHGQDRDPLGERASYKVVRDSKRTSSFITSGSIELNVSKVIREDPKTYQTDISYDLKVILAGRQNGTSCVKTIAEYFTEDMIKHLRDVKHFETPEFKVDHLGFETVRNGDGQVYENCDKLFFYDVDVSCDESGGSSHSSESSIFNNPQNVKITAHDKYGFPVLGAVRFDMSGRQSGKDFKVGADYVSH